ncbi:MULTISPECIES: DUF2892 domain-containing protein [unclassified Yoonia]|uniref:YgaP family membrane protein n=1 Tax=unclassified Yoonia TaxID=2629118 RepID=UPI00372B7686
MTANVGTVDRGLRVILGIALIVAPLLNFLGLGASAVVAYILMAIGAILILTGLFSFCPLYRVLNIRTKKA